MPKRVGYERFHDMRKIWKRAKPHLPSGNVWSTHPFLTPYCPACNKSRVERRHEVGHPDEYYRLTCPRCEWVEPGPLRKAINPPRHLREANLVISETTAQ